MTETWLTEDNATVLSEAAPANLGLMNKYQTGRKERGEAALFKEAFQCKEISAGDFNAFEYLSFILKGIPKIQFLIIYRAPRYSANFDLA